MRMPTRSNLKGPILLPHGTLRPTKPGSPNKSAKIMAKVKSLQEQELLSAISAGRCPSSQEIINASVGPVALTMSDLGVVDASKEVSDGTSFLLACRAENYTGLPPAKRKGNKAESVSDKETTLSEQDWKENGWILKKENMLTIDLPKYLDKLVDWGYKYKNFASGFDVKRLDDSKDWRAMLWIPTSDFVSVVPADETAVCRLFFACRTDHTACTIKAEAIHATAAPEKQEAGLAGELEQGHVRFGLHNKGAFTASDQHSTNKDKDHPGNESIVGAQPLHSLEDDQALEHDAFETRTKGQEEHEYKNDQHDRHEIGQGAEQDEIHGIGNNGKNKDKGSGEEDADACPTVKKGHDRYTCKCRLLDIKAETLEVLLREAKNAVHRRAAQIRNEGQDGTYQATFQGTRTPDEIATIRHNASQLADQEWVPSFAMIDKDSAELKALEKGESDIGIVMSLDVVLTPPSFVRWVQEHKLDTSSSGGNIDKPSISHPAMDDLLKLVRPLQRVRDFGLEWERAIVTFKSEVDKLCTRHKLDRGTSSKIISYFEKNWLCENWRGKEHWTDAGLPTGASRDGPMNTNNYAESSFRTIKTVFLAGMKNKRVDQLVCIIINDIFPYFAIWPPTAPRPSKELLDTIRWGHNLWQISSFECEVNDNGNQIWYIIRDSRGDQSLRDSVAFEAVVPGIIKTVVEIYSNGTQKCPCNQWIQTGKYCCHLWAMSWYFNSGTLQQYQGPVLGATSKGKGSAGPNETHHEATAKKQIWDRSAEDATVYSEHISLAQTVIPDISGQTDTTSPMSYQPVHSKVQSESFALPINARKKGRSGFATPIRGSKQTVRCTKTKAITSQTSIPSNKTPLVYSYKSAEQTCAPGEESKVRSAHATTSQGVDIKQGCGMINTTGTAVCYLNSAFQVLLHLPAVRDKLLEMQLPRSTRSHTKITNAPRYLMINLDRTEERQLGDLSSKGVKIHKELDLSEYAEGKTKVSFWSISRA
ncbi:hypothetical protein QFC22_002947 [Naganishia vaughanmartiniae]|uniref:Uncharacterized protein n=1 Tax=Naganishia vaughanmartiniae TaxID=1424756 RepID=A0ACC2X8Y2_9TREE|nr:hypothetical protein QFC22_002947 [Naganishia vaughanmartiniae]